MNKNVMIVAIGLLLMPMFSSAASDTISSIAKRIQGLDTRVTQIEDTFGTAAIESLSEKISSTQKEKIEVINRLGKCSPNKGTSTCVQLRTRLVELNQIGANMQKKLEILTVLNS